jgi:hypothetical protein
VSQERLLMIVDDDDDDDDLIGIAPWLSTTISCRVPS